MNIDYHAIGLRIRKLRRQKQWTQEKLAEKAEIAPDYLCRIELGKKHPSLKTILLVAGALDTTADDLLADVQRVERPAEGSREASLFAGCSDKQKHFILAVCQNIIEEMQKYEKPPEKPM